MFTFTRIAAIMVLMGCFAASAQQFYLGGLARPVLWYNGTSYTTPVSAGTTNETVLADLSGNGLHAIEDGVNFVPSLVNNDFGAGLHGIRFTPNATAANSQRLAIANNQALNSDANGYRYKTLSFMIKTPATLASVTGETEFVLYEQGNGTTGLVLYLTSNGVTFDLEASFHAYSGCIELHPIKTGLALNTRYMVTYYYNYLSRQVIIYVDGDATGTQIQTVPTPPLPGVCSAVTAVDSMPQHTGNIKMGANGDNRIEGASQAGTNRFFGGSIGETIFYNTAGQAFRKILENAIGAKYNHPLNPAVDKYNETTYSSSKNQLIGIGRESASDQVTFNEFSGGGLHLTGSTFLADAGDYIFAGHNNLSGTSSDPAPPAPFVGPLTIANREWIFSVTDAGTSGGNITIAFDLDELGLPLTSASKYFLIADAFPLDVTLGTGTIQTISSTSRRILFTVDVNNIDGFLTAINGLSITVGIDNVVALIEQTSSANCSDGLDNDFDGLADVFDPGCKTTTETSCTNGLDEDQDGLLDCFDNDCAGTASCDDDYFGPATPDCQYVPKQIDDFTVDTLFRTAGLLEQRCGVFVGDLDNDGVPEAVGKRYTTISVFSGKTGATLQRITTPTTGQGSTFAFADVDADGLAEIFVVGTDSFLNCFQYDPANGISNTTVPLATGRKWVSNVKCLGPGTSPQIADFDQDGDPEVYVGNDIFDAITGTRRVNGISSQSAGLISNSYDGEAWPIAYDVFSQSFGLELVAGNRVYRVNMGDGSQDNGSLIELSYAPNGLGDGFTSVADMNLNGKVDVITSSSGRVYVWEPNFNAVGTQLGTTYTTPNGNPTGTTARGARCNVGNFDADQEPEIGIAAKNVYTVINYNIGANTLSTMVSSGTDPWPATSATTGGWNAGQTGIVDDSEISGSTLFDFEGDGTYEIIYSDERSLYIWRAATAKVLLKLTKGAGTRSEYPLVVDVDADEIPEVVFTGQPGSSPTQDGGSYGSAGYIKAVKMRNFAPVKTRITWNQHGFFNTNINDDLTIPRVQQNASDLALCDVAASQCRLNGFLTQTTILDNQGAPIFPSPDPTINNFNQATGVDLSDCDNADGDSRVTITIPVINNGATKVASGMPVSVFQNDPFSVAPAPVLLATGFTTATLNVNGTTSVSVTFENPLPATTLNFTLLVNDIGISTTGFPYGQGATADARRSDSLHSGSGDCKAFNNIYRGSINSCILLSVALIDFTAENNTNTVDLAWTVGEEDRANLYVLERAGEDLTYEAIGSYSKATSGLEYNTYKHTDYAPLEGRSFYRVKIVGMDGSTGFSEVVEVRRGDISGSFIRIYPNPVSSTQRLTVDGLAGLNVTDIHMFNALGAEVRSSVVDGAAAAELLLEGLKPGMYTLRINGGDQSYWRKVVVK